MKEIFIAYKWFYCFNKTYFNLIWFILVQFVCFRGEVADVRERTQAAQFQEVVGLAWAQGLFYWTDGERLLAEEYHQPTKSYFHNLLYPDSAFSSIALDLEATQPLPVPVNPPTNLQAIMGSDLAKASWNLPHLLAGQGKSRWFLNKFFYMLMFYLLLPE